MQLEKLTLTDVGTFGGKQIFDLAPRTKYGAKRPIILFGGLNGAGKTTFLTAIRLALYGRHLIETGTTQRQYDDFLRDLIHRPSNSLVRTTDASISLEFTHARLGERVLYRVLRTWSTQSIGVEERLRIFRNNEENEALADEQAQAFLNQLIPSGISQFFFFDGEKIAAFAKDNSDAVLSDAIRRLLGLDLADRLSSDLSVFLRQRRASSSDQKTRTEIAAIEAELLSLEEATQAGMHRLQADLARALDNAKAEYERRRSELMDRGGAWAVNRGELELRLDALRAERRDLEERLREQLAGPAIFTLAPRLSKSVVNTLEHAQSVGERRTLAKAIKEQAGILKARLSALEKLKGSQRLVGTCIDEWVSELSKDSANDKMASEFGLSATEARNTIVALAVSAPSSQRELATIYGNAHKIAAEEDAIQEKLAHAPSEESLKDAFDALTKSAEAVATHEASRKQLIEEMRSKTWMCIDLTRKLKKLELLANQEGSDIRGQQTAEQLQEMIEEFKKESAKEKCKILRTYFIAAFSRLARKSDIVHDANIDPESFTITLLDRAGNEIPKKRLSAGEMQIYAIAMLEALAKTSGRNLPIIIDTPLGRLDSTHRRKLVSSYFPIASHQVIVLSTDTEVDLAFYQGLQPHLSHGYHLQFDAKVGGTTAEEGYFWKNLPEELRGHAA